MRRLKRRWVVRQKISRRSTWWWFQVNAFSRSLVIFYKFLHSQISEHSYSFMSMRKTNKINLYCMNFCSINHRKGIRKGLMITFSLIHQRYVVPSRARNENPLLTQHVTIRSGLNAARCGETDELEILTKWEWAGEASKKKSKKIERKTFPILENWVNCVGGLRFRLINVNVCLRVSMSIEQQINQYVFNCARRNK